MKRDKWVWMPHAGHLIVGSKCQFHLSTYVGTYIVSTVGDWWPERSAREIHAKVYDPKWLDENIHLRGDEFDHAYMKKFGFEEIGAGRKYETMVFKVLRAKEKNSCCPWRMASGMDVDADGYNDPGDAFKGHLKMCKKWSEKKSVKESSDG